MDRFKLLIVLFEIAGLLWKKDQSRSSENKIHTRPSPLTTLSINHTTRRSRVRGSQLSVSEKGLITDTCMRRERKAQDRRGTQPKMMRRTFFDIEI